MEATGEEALCDAVQDCLFGSAPSQSEAERALTDLHNFTAGISPPGTVLDRLQHTLLSYHPKVKQSYGHKRVRRALNFLHTDSSFQRMVVSLSCDKALWNAVMNNKEVVEIKERLLPVNAVFQAHHPGDLSKPNELLEEKIVSSVLLCIVNLLIIVLARAQLVGS